MKKLLCALTALSMTASLFGCADDVDNLTPPTYQNLNNQNQSQNQNNQNQQNQNQDPNNQNQQNQNQDPNNQNQQNQNQDPNNQNQQNQNQDPNNQNQQNQNQDPNNQNQQNQDPNNQNQQNQPTANAVDDCTVNWYQDKMTTDDAFTAYVQVHLIGVTGKTGTHNGLRAQFGYISVAEFLSNSAAGVDAIHWVDATRNDQFNGDKSDSHDEFMTTGVKVSNAGQYGVGYRVSTDGTNWTYCGVHGIITDPSTLAANVGFVEVSGGTSTPTNQPAVNIGWCKLTYAEDIGNGAEFVAYAQVYAEGVTGSANNHQGIVAELGHVNVDDYLHNGAQITFGPAKRNDQYNGDAVANNDEYMNNGNKPGKTGWHALIYRFSGDGGKTWTHCGKNGPITSMDNIAAEIWSVNVQ